MIMRKKCQSCRGKKPGYRCWFCDDANAARGVPYPAGWPMASEALAVHPRQRKEATEDAKKKGVPTYFDRHGRPVFRSQGHRSAYLKAYNKIDKNGSYGDYTGRSYDSERTAMAKEAIAGADREFMEGFLGGE